jgi:dipeptidase D
MAAIATGDDTVLIRTSQRSLDDEQRLLTTAMITTHFEAVGAVAFTGNCYPGWKPQPGSRLTGVCAELWEKRSGKPMKLGAIHAGLETGAFSKKNPDLELISIGPEAHGFHTPQECLSISSTCRFYDYLIEVVKALA